MLGTAPGVLEANVYGVEVPGADGRAGMATLVIEGDFDADAPAHVERTSPPTPDPASCASTARSRSPTFSTASATDRRGVRPGVIDDPLWYLDPERGSYVPLDAAAHAAIVDGTIRL
ncbi:MAG: hypothetical protein R2695_03940 [Acidimicrobiales bacterium]